MLCVQWICIKLKNTKLGKFTTFIVKQKQLWGQTLPLQAQLRYGPGTEWSGVPSKNVQGRLGPEKIASPTFCPSALHVSA